jgi:hypothetical protein
MSWKNIAAAIYWLIDEKLITYALPTNVSKQGIMGKVVFWDLCKNLGEGQKLSIF